MRVIGIETEGAGTNNQIRGVVLEAYKNQPEGETVPKTRKDLLKADDGRLLHPLNYGSPAEFEAAVQQAIDVYLHSEKAPDFVVLPFDHAAPKVENLHVDMLSAAIKKAFLTHGKQVKTMVLASNLYDYKNVDLIHIGKHSLSDADELKLEANPQLRARVIETLGVPSNLSWLRINNEANKPQFKPIIDQYRGKLNFIFSLGGKTDNDVIKFTTDDAKRLLETAKFIQEKYTECGEEKCNIIFLNSPRTPNDVTDYLYEECAQRKGMTFFNSKKVAVSEEEKKNFRLYDGKYNAEFTKQMETLGNVYPAILSLLQPDENGTYKGFVVNTHDSFSYTSDAAALGIPSVVYTGNEIGTSRQDCYKLFRLCAERGHVMDLAAAKVRILCKEPIKTKPMEDISSQLVKAMLRQLPRDRIKTVTRSAQYE